MSARITMLRMHRDGLPPPPRQAPTVRRPPVPGPATDQPPVPPPNVSPMSNPSLSNPAGTRMKAASGTSSSLAATRRGAQMRYFVWIADSETLAVLGFGDAAWKIAPQCGDPETRRRNLPLVVARFPILPWVRIRNLVVLTLVERRLPDDWESRRSRSPAALLCG